jgi:hypothetical protein
MSGQTDIKAMMIAAIFTESTDPASMAEDVVYTPATGTPRTIRALVSRQQADAYGNTLSPMMTVSVANDATQGIVASSLNVGSDTITVSERPGKTAEARNINRILINNAAYLRLELR